MYSPLPSCHHTRIVEIAQACNGTLVLRLTVLDVGVGDRTAQEDLAHSCQTYDALSYTWGAPVLGPQHETAYDASHDVGITIVVDEVEHKTKIGRNLFEALLQIYTSANDRPIWIDAICINQSDIKEKESHILLMCEIYSKAQRVIVWFGADLLGDFKQIIWLHETVLDLVRAHVDRKGELSGIDFRQSYDPEGVKIVPLELLLPGEALRALYDFYGTRRYIHRAWVAQEVAMANECVALLGNRLIDFARFPSLLNNLGDLDGKAYRFRRSTTTFSYGNEIAAFATTAKRMLDWKASTLSRDLQFLFGTANDDDALYLALLEFYLSQGTVRQATDPRDLIYCLLGMCGKIYGVNDIVRPDYSGTVSAIFTNLTSLLLRRLPHRTILSLVAAKPTHATYVEQLPSWVPDFATKGVHLTSLQMFLTVRNMRSTDFEACLEGPSELMIEHDQLQLYARRCASIATVVRPLWQPHGPGFEIVAAAERLLSLLEPCVPLMTTGSHVVSALMRTICFGNLKIDDEDFLRLGRLHLAYAAVEPGLVDEDDPHTILISSRLEKIFEQLSGDPIIPRDVDIANAERLLVATSLLTRLSTSNECSITNTLDYLKVLHQVFPEYPWDQAEYDRMRAVLEAPIDNADADELAVWQEATDDFSAYSARRIDDCWTGHDTFFFTSQGIIGRTTVEAQPGDELWLFCQAKVPFVLRPVGDNYRLLGEAYVEGAMYGEFVKNGTAEPATRIVIV